ncbi:protein polybromo-1-like [Musca autumnalis]|uniref:protein polybromo-1-like n=1 Tax=Musca autumnalis TaxID=221902 RepID=UPI003CF1E0E4
MAALATISIIMKKEDEDDRCRAPKGRQEPSYYDVANNPIDLLKIQQKLKTDVYKDLDGQVQDFELLVNNAKAFNKPDTDAVAICYSSQIKTTGI